MLGRLVNGFGEFWNENGEAIVEFAGITLTWAGYILSPLLLLPILLLLTPSALERPAKALTGFIDRITGTALGLAVFAAFAIILIQLAGVLLRYVFGLSFSWLNDSVIFTFAMIFMLGAAGTLREDGHVRVDILRSRFSPKVKAMIELIGALVFIIPICILILYAGSGLIARTWVDLEPFNESDGLPIKFLFKTMVPLFAILLMAQGLSQSLKAALAVRRRLPFEETPHEHGGAV